MSFAEACGAADASRAARLRSGRAAHARRGHRPRPHRLVRHSRHPARQDAGRRRACRARCASGIGMVSTILLKDTSDRTAYRVFEPGVADALPGFGFANNLVLLPDPASFRAPAVGARHRLDARRGLVRRRHAGADRHPPHPSQCARSPRRARASASPAASRSSSTSIASPTRRAMRRRSIPQRAAWPGEPPAMTMIHPGYNLLAEGWADIAPTSRLRIVQRTAEGLGPAARLARDRARAEPGRGGVRRRPMRSTAADQMVAVPQRRDARRCAAPATTPASSAGRRSRT